MDETIQKFDHYLAPQHIKLSEEEKQEFLNENNISTNQLPQILSTDSAIKNLNVTAGNVIKIVRKSPTTKETVFYRVVING